MDNMYTHNTNIIELQTNYSDTYLILLGNKKDIYIRSKDRNAGVPSDNIAKFV